VPPVSDPREALELLHIGVEKAGYTGRFQYGLDCAATHFYDADENIYRLAGKPLTAEELLGLYLELIRDFGITTIEDPFAEDDFTSFAALTAAGGIQIVGDDLFVTNTARLLRGIDAGAANALLWKVNQIGTLSEALDAAAVATSHGYGVCVSERSGETEDPIIADLVVALNAGQIKTGAPVRGERTAKYNRLLQIEAELGSAARYPGASFPAISVSRCS
jgi:enolase 1/2/3